VLAIDDRSIDRVRASERKKREERREKREERREKRKERERMSDLQRAMREEK
jgi:hypothetical protein